jgi:hypothetical protein
MWPFGQYVDSPTCTTPQRECKNASAPEEEEQEEEEQAEQEEEEQEEEDRRINFIKTM